MTLYRTGSSVNPYIKNPSDIDYVRVLDIGEQPPAKRECNTMTYEAQNNAVEIWRWEYEYMVVLDGSPHTFTSFFELRDRYIAKLKKFLFYKGKRIDYKNSKLYYYCLQGLYILENNSYDLTADQANNVQLAHDGKLPQEVKDWLYERVAEL